MKKDLHQVITNQIIDALEKVDVDNFKNPFLGGGRSPVNALTGKNYRGINILLLWAAAQEANYASNTWASFAQWKNKGAQVKKGEKSSQIIFYKKLEKTDPDTNESENFMMMRTFSVFNADQVEGWNPEARTGQVVDNDDIEAFIATTGATIIEDDSAFYRPSSDTVHMPKRAQFLTTRSTATDNYYAVLFHELTHWTKAQGRCDRKFEDLQPAYRYPAEELVAELGSAFLCAHFGIHANGREDHAMYIKSWLEALTNDKKFIFRSATLAQAAFDYLLQSKETEE
ncbi:MAG: zincin-like metallopeptidase domain-containing protein [Pseudohongiella sp.]|nr:zincin-like metallopeptidase domain-containing protein [Pseudohongiella sp.]